MALFKTLRLPSAPIRVQRDNQENWNRLRSVREANFYTIGYVGREPNALVLALNAAGVVTVVDIRFTPISQYRPQFSKENLRRLLAEHEIGYEHRPDLGVPKDIRSFAMDDGNRTAIWEWYDQYVSSQYVKNLTDFFNSHEHPIAFLCVEADPTACHRHRLSLALERLGLSSYDL